MHKYVVVLSSYHQCLKGVWVGKVTVRALENLFDTHEAHFSDAVYFSEMGEVAQTIIVRPRGLKIPKWDDIKEEKEGTRLRDSTATEAATPRKITKVKEGEKTVYCL